MPCARYEECCQMSRTNPLVEEDVSVSFARSALPTGKKLSLPTGKKLPCASFAYLAKEAKGHKKFLQFPLESGGPILNSKKERQYVG